MKKKLLYLFGGPGAGKDTVIDELGKLIQLARIPRLTTKPNTRNEQEGVIYRFVSEEEFDAREGRLFFVQRHAGYRYGIERDYLSERWKAISAEGKQPIMMGKIDEGLAVRAMDPENVILVYLAAPSAEEAERRVLGRLDDPAERQKKIEDIRVGRKHAEAILSSKADGYKIKVVINDELPNTVQQVAALLK